MNIKQLTPTQKAWGEVYIFALIERGMDPVTARGKFESNINEHDFSRDPKMAAKSASGSIFDDILKGPWPR